MSVVYVGARPEAITQKPEDGGWDDIKTRRVRLPAKPTDIDSSDGALIIAITADFCGHCTELKPLFDELASAFPPGALAFARSEDHPGAVLDNYGVRGFPHVVAFVNGTQIKFQGARTAEKLRAFAERFLEPVQERA